MVVGAVLGIPGALYVGHLAAGLLYRVKSDNPWVYLGGAMMLGICAAVAGMIPARRAASINPIDALRTD
jgi:ABC-type antimicrobial peptide transport system permease subunit